MKMMPHAKMEQADKRTFIMGRGESKVILKKIYNELVQIRIELQAIREAVESYPKPVRKPYQRHFEIK